MSSFWDLSDGGAANEDVKSEFEIPGGQIELIPNNSDVLAHIKDVKWAGKNVGEKYINIQWRIEKPEQLANRTFFQKLWVSDLDPNAKDESAAKAKRDKARVMLATIDHNAKGRLVKSMEHPTDDSLALALVDARMVVKVMEYSIYDKQTGDTNTGNWVSAIKSRDSETRVGKAFPIKDPTVGESGGGGGQPSGGGGGAFDMDDEIPFAPEWRI